VCTALQAVDSDKDIAEYVTKASTGTDRPGTSRYISFIFICNRGPIYRSKITKNLTKNVRLIVRYEHFTTKVLFTKKLTTKI